MATSARSLSGASSPSPLRASRKRSPLPSPPRTTSCTSTTRTSCSQRRSARRCGASLNNHGANVSYVFPPLRKDSLSFRPRAGDGPS
eukprot:933569-Pyramimonas_sp.AAC.1